MALPPGFLDELRTRVTLSDVIGRKVVWDGRRSNRAKGDWWAPCPFHQEKTASFHVDDRKGFYYCFGCHAKGDAISFLRESENLNFIEAVATLASEAGMEMPAEDPEARQKADRREVLRKVMEEAVRFYRLQLATGAAAEARAYLAGRGLTDEALARWRMGFAPAARTALFDALRGRGIGPDLIIDAGLAIRRDDGAIHDRFRGRVIFPIDDARGRPISLGGRALRADARAKYLNGPETALFSKSRTLFNHARARAAAGPDQPLIVVEGYMDVIAMVEAGFAAAVAPLGTAVTADQLHLLWRMGDEPVVALDGDAAGLRAAGRIVDLALPLIRAGKGLRFATLPGGRDPDDLLRAEGAEAMKRLIAAARPMIALVWQRETEGRNFDSPERRAALDARLREVLGEIADPVLRRHYAEALRQLRWQLFRTPRGAGRQGKRKWTGPGRKGSGTFARAMPPPEPLSTTRSSLLAATDAAGNRLREAVILAILLRHPALVERFESPLAGMVMTLPLHHRIRELLLSDAKEQDGGEEARQALDRLLTNPHVRITPALRPEVDDAFAALCLEEALSRLEAERVYRSELTEAQMDVEGLVDERLTWRVSKAAELRASATRLHESDRIDAFVAPNGVAMDPDEREEARRLFESIDFTRAGRRES